MVSRESDWETECQEHVLTAALFGKALQRVNEECRKRTGHLQTILEGTREI